MMMYSGAVYGRRLVHFSPLRQIVALATDFVKQAILRIITILLYCFFCFEPIKSRNTAAVLSVSCSILPRILLRYGPCRLFDHLRERRVCVHRARHILRTGAILQRQHALSNQMRSLRPQNMHAQEFIGLYIGENFYQTVYFIHAVCPGIGTKLVFAERQFAPGREFPPLIRPITIFNADSLEPENASA